MKKVIYLPARAFVARSFYIELPRFEGVNPASFKASVRALAKKHPLYHTPIQTSPSVSGRSDTGVEIPINTLGRWLFGVPGYAGNAVFDAFQSPPRVWLPTNIDDEALELIKRMLVEC